MKRAATEMQTTNSAGVDRIFDEIDRDIEKFRLATGLGCPSGCGQCCLSPEVETTIAECVPLAEELFRRGDALDWHERLSAAERRAPCAFYAPEPGDSRKGRCSVYSFRPSICRLFGFAGRKDKYGNAILSVCHVHKSESTELVANACEKIRETPDILPLFSDYSTRLTDQGISADERFPINLAIRQAIEIAGLRRELEAQDSKVIDVLPDDPDEPPTPTHPENSRPKAA